MKYEKPAVQPLAAAVSCVQHPTEKAWVGLQDCISPVRYISVAANEVDE